MLNIQNGNFLSVDYNKEFIGENFNYRNVSNISIQGTVLSNAESGVSQTWSEIQSYTLNDWEDVQINGYNLGSGQVTSISLPEGLDVRSKVYNISLSLYSNGNSSNLTGDIYNIPNLPSGDLKYIDSLSESFDFSADQKYNYNYNKSVSFGVIPNITGDPVSIAKSVASGLFVNDPMISALNAQYPNFYLTSGKKQYSETYDLDTNQYDFSEKFVFRDNNPYYWDYTQNVNVQAGVASVSENGSIVGIAHNAYSAASGAFSEIKTGAYSRANELYSFYTASLNSGTPCSLFSGSAGNTESINQCEGTIDYSFSFTNDPTYQQTGVVHSYSLSTSKSGPYYNTSENGSITAYGASSSGDFVRAKNKYNEIKPEIPARASGFLARSIKPSSGLVCGTNTGLFKLSYDEEYSEHSSNVGYNYSYTNDPNYLTDDPNFIRVSITSGDSSPVHFINNFDIPNFKEIAQPSSQSTLGTISFESNILGRADTPIQTYINQSFSGMSTGSLGYMKDASYSFDPIGLNFALKASFVYSKYRRVEDFLIW